MGDESTVEGTAMSSIESSQMSTEGGGGDKKESSSAIVLVALCFLLLLVIGVGYSVFGAAGPSEDATEEASGGGGGGGGGPSGPSGPSGAPRKPPSGTTKETEATSGKTTEGKGGDDADATDTGGPIDEAPPTAGTPGPAPHTPFPPPPAPPKATTTKTTTTTKAPFSVKELVCTVGWRAVIPFMIPPDGLCHFLYYVDVVVVYTRVHGIHNEISWKVFQAEIKKQRKTQGGLSFDIRYVDVPLLNNQNVIKALNALASSNMKNYGLLTVVATQSSKLAGLVTKAKNVLEKLKSMQGNDKNRKTIIALGLYDFTNAWSTYQAQFKLAVETTKADTVIALSSTGGMERDEKCFMAPPSAIDPSNKRFPDMKQMAGLMARSMKYSKADTKVGLSFDLGVLLYKMSDAKLTVNKVAYAKCVRSTVAHKDVPCIKGHTSTEISGGNFGVLPNISGFAYAFESAGTMRDKVNSLKSSIDLRPAMSWLMNNAHLGPFSTACGGDDHFYRLRYVKEKVFLLP